MSSREAFLVQLRFYGDLSFFVKGARGPGGPIEIIREPTGPASVKDLIESCGVPHPEVNQILVNKELADFQRVIRNKCDVDVYPVAFTELPFPANSLQRRFLDRFVVDGHLGKLARNLRLLGFDVAYDRDANDRELLAVMQQQERALLTRDRPLLMHAVVRDAYCPRSDRPAEQTIEVLRRFKLTQPSNAFTRCLQCNSILQAVPKADILDQLEPLTRLYYEEFRRCPGCGKIYWRGSHCSRLEISLQRFRAQLQA